MSLANGYMGYLTGLIVGVGIGFVTTWDDPTSKQVGITYKEVKQMKNECEKELPRNKRCVPVLTFKVEEGLL